MRRNLRPFFIAAALCGAAVLAVPALVDAKQPPKATATQGLVVHVDEVTVPPNQAALVHGYCPSGWFAVGAGYTISRGLEVTTSRYLGDELGSGWQVFARMPQGINPPPGHVSLVIQCLPVASVSEINTPPGVVPPEPN